MASERDARIEALFHSASKLAPAERTAYLESASSGDPELRAEVEALLAALEESPEFLDTSSWPLTRESKGAAAGEGPTSGSPGVAGLRIIGDFRIVRELGRGGWSTVYEAEQLSLGRRVALKILPLHLGLSAEAVGRFQREAKAVGRQRHPGIVTIFSVGEDDGLHYIAMELVDGVPLSDHVLRNSLSLTQRLELFGKICEAVHHAHRSGVIHRDLKPANILITDAGEPKIVDFGLARITGGEQALQASATATGQIMGTLRYMSPEQARGASEEIDDRSDVYALGVILYDLLTGRLPYEVGGTAHEAVSAICETPPTKPSRIDRSLRGDLETIVLRALAKEKERRYQSAEDLVGDIRRYLQGEPILARPPSGFYILRKRVARHRLAVGFTLLAAVLVVAGVLGGIWSKERRLAKARYEALSIMRELDIGEAREKVGEAAVLAKEFPELPEAFLVGVQAEYREAKDQSDGRTIDFSMKKLDGQIDKYPSCSAYRLLKAEIETEQGNLDKERPEQLEQKVSADAESSYNASFATLDPSRATRLAENAVELDPGHLLAWERLAYLYLLPLQQDCERALGAVKQLVAQDGETVSRILLKAHILAWQGKYEFASGEYSKAINREPNTREGYALRGAVRFCLRDYDGSVEDLKKRAKMEGPNLNWSRRWLATAHWIRGDMEESIRDNEVFQEQYPTSDYVEARLWILLRHRAIKYRKEGREAEADTDEQKAKDWLDEARITNSDRWLKKIFDCLAGEITPEKLVAEAGDNAKQICEACYYAGEFYLLEGLGRQNEILKGRARNLFKRCIKTDCILDPEHYEPNLMSEYLLARWRYEQFATGVLD